MSNEKLKQALIDAMPKDRYSREQWETFERALADFRQNTTWLYVPSGPQPTLEERQAALAPYAAVPVCDDPMCDHYGDCSAKELK